MPPPARPQLQRQSTSGKTLVAQRNSGTCQRLLRESVIDPRTNKYIAYWDLVTTAGLVFTALVTPVEVAFLAAPSPAERWSDPLFLINRIIDLIFCFDMLIQFVLITQVVDRVKGVRWVEVRMNALNLQTADANRTREPTFACMYAAQYLLLLPPIS